jgi:hypothetical protein
MARSQAADGIDYFGRGHWLTAIQTRISYRARWRMFRAFHRFAGSAGGRVLDVGATPDRERLDSNCMIPWLHKSGFDVSLYSPEDIAGLQAVFPYATVLPSAGFGRPIPAADRSYDWVSAGAVLEHVGSNDQQAAFVQECARVGDGLFLTTPNRRHWLEFHTKLPLIHWLPRETHRSLLARVGLQAWADEQHLNLLSRSDLETMAARTLGASFDWTIRGVWSLGMPSNLILLARRR